MTRINIDFETRSVIDLRKTGVYPYAEHPTTDVWCMAYAIDGGDVQVWSPHLSEYAAAPGLREALPGAELRAWNSGFEHIIWREIMVKRYGFPEVQMEQWHDTAAEAAAMALPRALGRAASVMGLDVEKDKEGTKLMMKMARPRTVGAWWARTRILKTGVNTDYTSEYEEHGPFATKAGAKRAVAQGDLFQDAHTVIWWDDEYMLRRLIDYCVQDVIVEREIAGRVRPLNAAERAVFLLNQRMNDRGIQVDTDLVVGAQEIMDQVLTDANAELVTLTRGKVQKVSQVSNIRRWMKTQGMEVEDLRKDTVRDLLKGELPDAVRSVLQIRQDAGKTSTAKLASFERVVAEDGRAHGLFLYHGASTGRWAGKLIQPQNFPRPELNAEPLIPLIRERQYAQLQQHGAPAVIIASALRSMLTAAPGHVLLAADYSQIEARVLAWLAGQEDLVQLFADGGKVYEEMAAVIYNMSVEDVAKDSFERQIGKNAILGSGFQMGWQRYQEQVWEQTGIRIEDKLAQDAIAGYRSKNDMIPKFWRDIERTAMKAARDPGKVYPVGVGAEIKFTYRGQFLWCQLPSKRFLAYALPEIQKRALPPPFENITKESLSYLGMDSLTNQWGRHYTYGGHLTENVVQAVARDLMAGAMLRVERAGYEPVLTAHDEVVVEAPQEAADLPTFITLMQTLPRWAQGLPVAAEGWQGERYRK